MKVANALAQNLSHLPNVEKEQFRDVISGSEVVSESLFDLHPSMVPAENSSLLTVNTTIHHLSSRLPPKQN